MAEMTTLAATIYQKYQTSLASGFEDVTPGITARFEVFQDDRYSKMMVRLSFALDMNSKCINISILQEHSCFIKFEEHGK